MHQQQIYIWDLLFRKRLLSKLILKCSELTQQISQGYKSQLQKLAIKVSYKSQAQYFLMRKRINFDLFKVNQLRAQKTENFIQGYLYKTSYELINDLLCDIKRPFKNICIHGFYPKLMIDHLVAHRQHLQQQKAQNKEILNNQADNYPKITIVDYLDIFQQKKYANQTFQAKVVKFQNNDQFFVEEEQFDLIISNLELNHTNNEEKLLQKYLRSLKSDGALVGCAMVEGTLAELHWSYLMAENERYGGLSPKIMNFPSIGQLGNILTSSHFHLTTVLNRDYHLEFDSPLQLIKALQILGQNSHLKGRRKAVYKDLLISMFALYQSQFKLYNQEQNAQKILSTLVLAPFVGWKYSPDQPKPLRRGQNGQSIDFIDELRKHDPQLEHYRITEDNDQPEQITPQKNKDKQKK